MDSLEPISSIEQLFRDAEASFGVGVTFHDVTGAFHDAQGERLLPRQRHSHKRFAPCAQGFCERCLQHCRWDINEELARTRRSRVFTCWKGLRELVVPVSQGEHFLGTLFVGTWRRETEPDPLPAGLPRKWLKLYRALPLVPDQEIARLQRLCEALADSIAYRLAHLQQSGDSGSSRRATIEAYLRRESAQAIQLADLARELSLSSSRTSHLVRQLFGRPFQQLLMEQRILKARVLLASSDYPIGEVARRVGFNDLFYFSKAFKKQVGASPSAFRKELGA